MSEIIFFWSVVGLAWVGSYARENPYVSKKHMILAIIISGPAMWFICVFFFIHGAYERVSKWLSE